MLKIQNFNVGHLLNTQRIVFNTVAQHAGNPQYNDKELRIETQFSGQGRNKITFTVTGRKDGKPFRFEFKKYDLAVDKYNGMTHTLGHTG